MRDFATDLAYGYTLMPNPFTRKGQSLPFQELPLSGLGKRLYQARLDLSAKRGEAVSQGEIAALLGVHQVTLGEWERGKAQPRLESIQALARIYGVDPGLLAFGSEEEPVPDKEAVPLAPEITPGIRGMHPLEKETPSGFPPTSQISHPIRPRKDAKRRRGGSG